MLTETTLIRVDPAANRGNVAFFVEDAVALGADVAAQGPFDLVVVDDILTRAVQPLHVLSALVKLVRDDGVLLVACDNDWDASCTPRNSWLGGFKVSDRM